MIRSFGGGHSRLNYATKYVNEFGRGEGELPRNCEVKMIWQHLHSYGNDDDDIDLTTSFRSVTAGVRHPSSKLRSAVHCDRGSMLLGSAGRAYIFASQTKRRDK
jgi:hypothetical protein